MRGNDEISVFQPEDCPEGLAHPQVVGHAALEGHRRVDDLPLGDITLQVPGHGQAETGDDLEVRGGALLQVDHVRLGKDAAAPGDAGGSGGFEGQPAELFDGIAQAVGLLVQEGAGARGAHGVHGEVLNHQVARLLRPPESAWRPRPPCR